MFAEEQHIRKKTPPPDHSGNGHSTINFDIEMLFLNKNLSNVQITSYGNRSIIKCVL